LADGISYQPKLVGGGNGSFLKNYGALLRATVYLETQTYACSGSQRCTIGISDYCLVVHHLRGLGKYCQLQNEHGGKKK
jgi:hypothetical protein